MHIATTIESFTGTTWINGEIDFADAIDLDTALATGAAALAQAGCAGSLDVRRSIALGDLARGETPFGLEQTDGPDQHDQRDRTPSRSAREVVVHVHLLPGSETARVDTNGRHLLTKEQVRTWCGNAATRVMIRPVIDLTAHLHVDQYEVRDRMVDQVAERDVANGAWAASFLNHRGYPLRPGPPRPGRSGNRWRWSSRRGSSSRRASACRQS